MSLAEKIEKDLPAALKGQEKLRLSVLRLMKAALKNRQIELGRPLQEEEAQAVLKTMVKQRQESVDRYREGGREDLARKEEEEMSIVQEYLPPPLADEDMEAAVEAAIRETGAAGPQDVGKVMKVVMARLAGRNVDGRKVNERVRSRLSGR